MKELIRVRVQYASRQQCCKTHKRPLSFLLEACWADSKINKIVIVASIWSLMLFTYIEDSRTNTNQIYRCYLSVLCLNTDVSRTVRGIFEEPDRVMCWSDDSLGFDTAKQWCLEVYLWTVAVQVSAQGIANASVSYAHIHEGDCSLWQYCECYRLYKSLCA